MKRTPIYGIWRNSIRQLTWWMPRAATTDAGYRKIDAYSPFPIEELAEAIGFHHERSASGGADRRTAGWRRRLSAAVLDRRHQLTRINIGGGRYTPGRRSSW